MPTEYAIHKAAQAWCKDIAANHEMDVVLGTAFAEVIDDILEEKDRPVSVKAAMDMLRKAMSEDAQYAWTWHCNLAMAAFDEGVDHATSNKIAQRFMKLCFGVETSGPKAPLP